MQHATFALWFFAFTSVPNWLTALLFGMIYIFFKISSHESELSNSNFYYINTRLEKQIELMNFAKFVRKIINLQI